MNDARPPRATLLVNPAARRVQRGFDPARLHRYLERHTAGTRLAVPTSRAEAVREARLAAERGDDLVFALGGDGTQRDAAEGLAGSETALAALPGGTVNIWCREAGIPKSIRAAAEALLGGQTLRIDLGEANGRPFLLMASLGWDAAVARGVSPGLKRRFGDYAYILQALRMAPGLRSTPARWRSGLMLQERRLAIMVVSNTRIYGGRVRFTPESTATDGLLDIAALCPASLVEVARLAAKVPFQRLTGDAAVVELRAAELTVETPGIPIQLDGDYAGETPVVFSVSPGVLAVRVPGGPLPAVLAGSRIATPLRTG